MTAQELKNSILQLAVQGKLVEQRPEEGTAKELLDQIKAEKEQLIKDKKIKKEKPLPEITDEEKPFDIPESWEWLRLGDLCSIKTGRLDANAQTEDGKYAFFTCGREVFKTDSYAFDCDAILLGGNNASGDYKMHRYEGKFNAYQRVYVISDTEKSVLDYLYFVITYWLSHLKRNSQGTTTRFIKIGQVSGMLIPFPPLKEQRRIVSKIEEILPYIDQYDKAYTKLEAFNKKFPEDMKKSVLQLAMRGKLVKQRPEEGTAEELYQQIVEEKAKLIKEGKIKKEKPLAEITDDEIPFEIPENWKLCKLAQIASKITDGEHKTPRRVREFCGYYLLSARNIRDGYISVDNVDYVDFDEYEIISKRCNPKKGDVLISCSGSVGRCAVVNDACNYVMVRSAAMISPIKINSNYLMYALQSEYVQVQIRSRTKQAVQANLFQDAIRNLIVPLPPLAEQKRIVAKIEEILPYCEQLVN